MLGFLFSLQREGSHDRKHASEQLFVHVKGEEEHSSGQVRDESTESELEEEEEDDEVVPLREGEDEERGSFIQVCANVMFTERLQRLFAEL